MVDDKGLSLDTLFLNQISKHWSYVFFVEKKNQLYTFVLVACVYMPYDKLKMKNNLITHLKLTFGISSFIPL